MDELKGALSVGDLIRELQKLPRDWKVVSMSRGNVKVTSSPIMGLERYWYLPINDSIGEVKKKKPKAETVRVAVLCQKAF